MRAGRCFVWFVIGVLLLMVTGCGSGGSGGGEVSGSVKYTGPTTKATITEESAEAFAFAYYNGSGEAGAMLTNLNSTLNGHKGYLAESMEPLTKATVEETVTLPGGCGGTASLSILVDTLSGSFSMVAVYNGFCEAGITISGKATIATSSTSVVPQTINMTGTYEGFVMVSPEDTLRMEGTVTSSLTGAAMSRVEQNIRIASEKTGDVVWFRDNVSEVTFVDSEARIKIGGAMYHSDYGSVEITTVNGLVAGSSQAYPSEGVLRFEGAAVSGGGTGVAEIEIVAGGYIIRVDAEGDGAFESISGTISWGSHP